MTKWIIDDFFLIALSYFWRVIASLLQKGDLILYFFFKDEDNGSDFAPWKASQSPEPAEQVNISDVLT